MTLSSDLKKVEDVVISVAEKAAKKAEVLFGKEAESFGKAAEALLAGDVGHYIKTGVLAAKTAFPNGSGAVLHAVASAFTKASLEQAGVTLGSQLLNLGIETVLSAL